MWFRSLAFFVVAVTLISAKTVGFLLFVIVPVP